MQIDIEKQIFDIVKEFERILSEALASLYKT